MKTSKRISLLALLVLLIYFSTFSSCSKELSCEGCLKDTSTINTTASDTTLFTDTTTIDSTFYIPPCNTCDSTQPLALNTWGFKVNNSYICGIVDSSLFDTEKHSVDFWGYLTCSKDTGFRIVAFFYPLTFTADRFNVSTTMQAFGIQDHVNYMNPWAGFILRTDLSTTPHHTIKVIVDSFNYSTRLMVGRFYGYAYTKNNEKAYVDGKFRFIVQ